MSPAMRHPLARFSLHVPALQACEQQSVLEMHASPKARHNGAPQIPFQQPSEQQSYASLHGLPSAKQCSVQWGSSSSGSVSQRLLQQVLLFEQSVPWLPQTVGSMQNPSTQKFE